MNIKSHRNPSEAGFTLLELMIVFVIIAILAIFTIPIFKDQKNDENESNLKGNLAQAATLIEQEKIDNNGLFPTYMPNELRENGTWKKFVYTYSANRLVYCLEGITNNTHFFVSSANKDASTTSCSQANVATNSLSSPLP